MKSAMFKNSPYFDSKASGCGTPLVCRVLCCGENASGMQGGGGDTRRVSGDVCAVISGEMVK